MAKVKFPIAPNVESIDGTLNYSKVVNGYAEVADAQQVRVHKRPALTLAQGSFAVTGQGLANTPDGGLFVVSGGDIYFPVPSYTMSVGAAATFTGVSTAVTVAYNGSAYVFGGNTPFRAYRAAPPFSTFSTLGTNFFGGAVAKDAVVHGGAVTVIAGTNIFYSTNGTSWGTYGAGGTDTRDGRLYSYGPNLYKMHAIGTGEVFYYTQNRGTAWTTGTMTSPAVGFVGWARGNYGGYMYALSIEGTGVYRSQNGVAWTRLGATPWDGAGLTPLDGDRFLGFNNSLLAVQADSATDRKLWASLDEGANWSLAGTNVSPNFSSASIFPFSIGTGAYAAVGGSSDLLIFSLSATGGLSLVSAMASINVPEDELASIISVDSGTTFIKTTTAAYTITSGVVTQVSDAQYPTVTVRGAVYLNGRLYVMEPDGTIWNSAEDDFTSWAGTDFITAEFEADGGVCLAKQGEYIIALGQFTTEAFYDAGNPTGSPLSPVNAAVLLIGCAHANSVAQAETALVWVAQQKGQGSTFHKGRFVVVMSGYGSYQRISTPDVERVLDADGFTQVYADIVTTAGHVFYVISLLDSDLTLAYDFGTKRWYEWSLATVASAVSVTSITQTGGVATATTSTAHGYSDGDQVTIAGANQAGYNLTINVTVTGSTTFTYPVDSATVSPATGTITSTGYTYGALDISASCYFNNEQLVQLRQTGDVYVLDVDGSSDNGAPIDFRIRTQLWDGGSNREKFMGDCEVVGEKVDTTGLLRYTDDNYQTYTKFKRLDLSLRRPRSRRGGSFSRRAVEFRQTLSASGVAVESIEADVEQGAV